MPWLDPQNVSLTDRVSHAIALIAKADAMFVEQRQERQARFDADHPEYEGKIGAAEPMDSAFRGYLYWRCRWSEELGLPEPKTALRAPGRDR
jgi:hypothetical protein